MADVCSIILRVYVTEERDASKVAELSAHTSKLSVIETTTNTVRSDHYVTIYYVKD